MSPPTPATPKSRVSNSNGSLVLSSLMVCTIETTKEINNNTRAVVAGDRGNSFAGVLIAGFLSSTTRASLTKGILIVSSLCTMAP